MDNGQKADMWDAFIKAAKGVQDVLMPSRDTNPDAPAAEAAQAAIEQPVHGQDDGGYKCPAEFKPALDDDTPMDAADLRGAYIDIRMQLKKVTAERDKARRGTKWSRNVDWFDKYQVIHADLDKVTAERNKLVVAAQDHCPKYHGGTAEHWFGVFTKTADERRATVTELGKQLDKVTAERDKLSERVVYWERMTETMRKNCTQSIDRNAAQVAMIEALKELAKMLEFGRVDRQATAASNVQAAQKALDNLKE